MRLPSGGFGLLRSTMQRDAIFRFKAETQLLGDAQSPDIVERADQHDRTFAKLCEGASEAGTTRNALWRDLKGRGGPRQRDDISQRQIAGVVQAHIELLQAAVVLTGASKSLIESMSMFLAGSPRQNVVGIGAGKTGSQNRSMWRRRRRGRCRLAW